MGARYPGLRMHQAIHFPRVLKRQRFCRWNVPPVVGDTTVPWTVDLAWIMLLALHVAVVTVCCAIEYRRHGVARALVWFFILFMAPVAGAIAWVIFSPPRK